MKKADGKKADYLRITGLRGFRTIGSLCEKLERQLAGSRSSGISRVARA
jgi:hypothetical protein